MMLPIHKGTHWCLAIIDFEASEFDTMTPCWETILAASRNCSKKLNGNNIFKPTELLPVVVVF